MYDFLLSAITTTTSSSAGSISIAEFALAGSGLTVVGVIIAAILTARRSQSADPTPLMELATKQGEIAAKYDLLRNDVTGLKSDLSVLRGDFGDVRESVAGIHTLLSGLIEQKNLPGQKPDPKGDSPHRPVRHPPRSH